MLKQLWKCALLCALASVTWLSAGCAVEAGEEEAESGLPFEAEATSGACSPYNTGDANCDAFCTATNSQPNCYCILGVQYRSKIEKRKRPMSGSEFINWILPSPMPDIDHGTTKVTRERRRTCMNGTGAMAYYPLPGVSTYFNYNHSSYPNLDDAAPVFGTETTDWTTAPPNGWFCAYGGYRGYCAYEGAAGCECGTSYGVSAGYHVCNDDAQIQVNGFSNGWCDPSSLWCHDNVLNTVAPF